MAKPGKAGALAAWREAEENYRTIIAPFLLPDAPGKIDKAAAVALTKARVKADRKMDVYLHRCLD